MSDISEIELDLEQAGDNLNRTLDAMDHKATATSELLLPEQKSGACRLGDAGCCHNSSSEERLFRHERRL
jgi:hypothetical protein